ncbi:amino acid adenylation domain-containing protein [Puniceicoccaceae bacterium K14]|nr:amino acid adenylation domain-containing protein [Puniceicoccaceae bacterium K14]
MNKDNIQDIYRLSPMQEGMLYHAIADADEGMYCVQVVFDIKGQLNEKAFHESWESVVGRHEALRTSFHYENVQQPVQIVWKEVSVEVGELDFSSLSAEDRDRAVIDFIEKDGTRPFEMNVAPLMRFHLITIGDEWQKVVWTHHHIITDGWSNGRILEEVFGEYASKVGGLEYRTNKPRRYKNYIGWLGEQDAEAAKVFWKSYLDGTTEATRISLESSHREIESQKSKRKRASAFLDVELLDRANDLCRANEFTLSSLLQGAWALLLSSYTGNDDVMFGVTSSGRAPEVAGVESMVGLFMNTLPIRIQVDRSRTLVDWLKVVERNLLDVRKYEYCSISDIRSWSDISANSRLFDSVFVVENTPIDKKLVEKSRVLGVEINDVQVLQKTDLPITVFAKMGGSGLEIEILFEEASYSEESALRILKSYEILFKRIVTLPNEALAGSALSGIELIEDSERELLLFGFNNTQVDYPKDKCIHELFEERAMACPGDIAVQFEGKAISYGELNERSNQLAWFLREEFGVGPDAMVSLCLERSIDLMVGILGVLKAGGAYVPIDPSYPHERIRYMLEDSDCKVLLTTASELDSIEGNKAQIVNLEEKRFASYPIENLPTVSDPSNLAYTIYTSGSTGMPKGVMIEHRSVVNFMRGMTDSVGLSKKQSIASVTTICFDIFVLESLVPLMLGMKIVLANREQQLDPDELNRMVASNCVDIIQATPSLMKGVVESSDAKESFVGVKALLVGGEPFPPELRDSIRTVSTAKVFNMYGPTETTVWSSVSQIEEDFIHIGKPIANTSIHIMGKNDCLLPRGAIGEICIAGDGLARGYWKRPELTEEKFVLNPFIPGERMYRTGDLGRWLPNGEIECFGRIDHQVKIRGFRIELGEIETELLKIPGVEKSVVVARKANGENLLVAYFVSSEKMDLSVLREHLGRCLPNYMIPAYFVPLDEIPLTSNGKVNRKALPEFSGNLESSEDCVAPKNAVERSLVEVWKSVLGVKQVWTNDNYFELGGDSIKSIQVVSKMRSLGYRLKVADIFEHPRLSDLGTHIDEFVAPIDQGRAVGDVELSPIMHWFFGEEMDNPNHWNQAAILRCEGGFEESSLQRALLVLGDRHDALRLRLSDRENSLRYDEAVVPFSNLEVVDIQGVDDLEARIEESATEAQRSLNLVDGPLSVAKLFRTSGGDHLFIAIHHLAIDGVSWRVLLEDLSLAYQAFRSGKEISLPPKTHSFGHWMDRLIDYSKSKTLQSEREYWEGVCSKKSLPLPQRESGSASIVPNLEKTTGGLNRRLTDSLLKQANETYGTKASDLLLASLETALGEWLGKSGTLVLNLEGHGREDIAQGTDVSRTVGWFTSQYPFELAIGGAGDFGERICRLKERARRVPKQGIGYGVLRYLCGNDLAEMETLEVVPEISFNHLGSFDADLEESGLSISSYSRGECVGGSNRNTCLLEINALLVEGELSFGIVYDKTRFDGELIEALAELYEASLAEVIEHCEKIEEPVKTPSDLGATWMEVDELEDLRNRLGEKADSIESIHPLTPLQEGMLYYQFAHKDSGTYVVQSLLELRGQIDVKKAQQAYCSLIRRHETLRSRYVVGVGTDPLQVFLNTESGAFASNDWRGLSADDQILNIEMLLSEDRENGFDLLVDCPIRFRLIVCSDSQSYLLVTNHHIAMDGWCMPLLMQEYLEAYASPEGVPNSGQQSRYSDYLKWLAETDNSHSRDYWKAYFSGFDTATRLPFGNATNAGVSYDNGRYDVPLGKELSMDLPELARKLRVTVNSVAQSLWTILLQRYNGREDVVFGNVISGRPVSLDGIDKMIGLFINTVPLRSGHAENRSFRNLVEDIQLEFRKSEENGYLSLAEIQSQCEVSGELFDHVFVFENYPVDEALSDGRLTKELDFEISSVRSDEQTNYNFNVILHQGKEGLCIRFDYNKNVYSTESVERIGQHFRKLAESAVANHDVAVSDMEILSEDESKTLLNDFVGTVVDYPLDQCLHALFEAQVVKTPNAIAIVMGQTEMTFKELNEKSNQLACRLRDHCDVGPNDIVALMVERSFEMIVGILGILKAGGAYLPIDPSYPKSRVDFILEDSDAKALLTQKRFSNGEEFATQVIDLELEETYEGLSRENLILQQSSRNLAYVIYTSGSTGMPKGAMLEHAGAVNRLLWMRDEYGIDESDVILQKTIYTFDVSVWELLLPGLTGARMCFLEPGGESDPAKISDAIDQHGVTTMHFVPSMLSAFLHWLPNPRYYESLRRVICSGEALTLAHKDLWSEKVVGNVGLHNLYGPTEASIDVTCCEVKPSDKSISIGKCVPNTQLYIVNENDALAPIGVAGELCIAGIQLARGYLKRPDLTGEKFVSNPFATGERMYRTGDLARWLSDGSIEYLDRIDNQVKVRGFRVELGEIENALRKKEEIREAVVVVKNIAGDGALVAYLLGGKESDLLSLKALLNESLPPYMVPSYFVFIEAIPLSANGKINRKALPEPSDSLALEAEYIAPRDTMEGTLVGIWESLLGTQGIGIEHDFFELGGHSIKAIQLLGKINHAFGSNLGVGDLYQTSTIRALADSLKSGAGKGRLGEALKIGYDSIDGFKDKLLRDNLEALPKEFEDLYPMTSIELGMIYSSELAPEQPVYYDQFVFQFRSSNFDRVREAFGHLVNKHEILRTQFYTKSLVAPAKVVLKSLQDIPLTVDDLSSLNGEEQIRAIKNFQTELLKKRYSFDGEILWQMHCFRLDEERHFSILYCHHSILDGWSVSVLMHELAGMVEASEGGDLKAPDLLKSSYRDYCAAQIGKAASDETTAFWKDTLEGCPRNKLPFNYSGKRRRDSIGMDVVRCVPEETLLGQLQQLASVKKVSLKSIFLAAQAYMSRLTGGEKEIVTGVVSHDRPAIEDGEKILGCFLSTIPVRVEVKDRLSPSELISGVHTYMIKASSHEMHLTDVAKAVGASFGNTNPFFDCLLNFTDFAVEDKRFSSRTLSGSREDWFDGEVNGEEMTNTLFDLEVDKSFDKLSIRIKYSPSYFDREDMQYALDLYVRILERFASESDTVLLPDQLITEREREFLVEGFNDTEGAYSDQLSLHQPFEQMAASNPELVALRKDGRSMTYGTLNTLSNQLAHQLQKEGVAQGDNVGLISERSFDMIVGMLGILKAGGAYVPVDPTYPLERQAYILSNSSANIAVLDSVTQIDSEGALSELRFVRIEEDELSGYDGSNLDLAIDPKQLAYTIYTSGSTGKPKGVMIEHRSAVNLVEWVNRRFRVDENDRLLFISSMCFDLSVYDIFGMLAAGGTLVIATLEQVREFSELKRLMVDEKITFWDSVPTTMDYLIRELEFESEGFTQNDLRVAFMSGDWIPVNLPDRMRDFFPNVAPISLGGATEGTVWSNYHPIEKVENGWSSIPYGVPITNNFFYIVDDDCRMVPPGSVGELCIGGLGVALGYANDEEKTSAAFVEDPFRKSLGGRMYKTGDLGRMMRTGEMEFLGRKDHQVKIRGYRVELGEVESHLLKLDGVKTAAVNASRDKNGNSFLAAYVVKDGDWESSNLRESLSDSLPFYMVPTYFIQMDSIPLTGNGKVNRKALPALDESQSPSTEFVAPRNKREESLAAIWKDILGAERVGMKDNFFELGGHSLMAVSAVAKIRKQFEVELSLRELYESPRLEGLVELLARKERVEYRGLSRVDEREWYPASSQQRRLYTLQLLDKQSVAYNLPEFYELDGHLAVEDLVRSLKVVIARHSILRGRFEMRGNSVAWLPGEDDTLDISVFECPTEKSLQDRLESFVQPFDLEEGPLLRVEIAHSPSGRILLLTDMHHIVSDGISSQILIRDFVGAYGGAKLEALPLHYQDYAIWQQEGEGRTLIETQKLYWKGIYETPPASLELPLDFPRPAIRRFEGASYDFDLGDEASVALVELGKRSDASSFMLLLAGFSATLSRFSGQDDIVVGSPTSGRDHADLENIMGMLVNTLALRSFPSGEKRFIDYLQEVKEICLGAFENQHYAFEDLVDGLDLPRDGGRNPLFDVNLVFQNFDTEDARDTLGSVRRLNTSAVQSKFDLTLLVRETSEGLSCSVTYATALFEESTIRFLVDALRQTLISAGLNPESKFKELPLFDLEEKALLEAPLAEDHTLEYGCVSRWFADNAKAFPSTIAVECGQRSLTYGELDDLSDRLVSSLLRKGLKSGDIVAACVKDPIYRVVTLVSVFKSGGVFMPLDLNMAERRWNWVLEELRPEWALVDEDARTSLNGRLANVLEAERIVDVAMASTMEKTSFEPLVLDNELPCYLYFTSGSTGEPKAISGRRSAVEHFVSWEVDSMGLAPGTRISQLTSFTFDAYLRDVWTALCCRGTVCVPKGADPLAGEVLSSWLNSNAIELVHCVPSLFRTLLGEDVSKKPYESLRRVLMSGEALHPSDVSSWRDRHGDAVKLVNLYGASETTMVKMFREVSVGDAKRSSIPVGEAMSCTQAFVLDEALNPCPRGAKGEIVMRTPYRSLGYYGRPDLTNKSFIENPFSNDSKDLLYRTGDIGRRLADGSLEFLGRLDGQVKIRGQRLELGEIESALLQQPGVVDAVASMYSVSGEKALIGYVIGEPDLDTVSLRQSLRTFLPGYMIPANIIVLPGFDRNANGKVDRKALPAPDDVMLLSTRYVAPENEIERVLCTVWQEVLGIEKVGTSDNFFDLGGHSLMVVKAVAQIEKNLHVTLAFLDLMELSIKELAAKIENERPKGLVGRLKNRLASVGAFSSSKKES